MKKKIPTLELEWKLMKKQMQMNQNKAAMAEMRRSLEDLLDLSRKEESLKRIRSCPAFN